MLFFVGLLLLAAAGTLPEFYQTNSQTQSWLFGAGALLCCGTVLKVIIEDAISNAIKGSVRELKYISSKLSQIEANLQSMSKIEANLQSNRFELEKIGQTNAQIWRDIQYFRSKLTQ